jgi:hypothetical protein
MARIPVLTPEEIEALRRLNDQLRLTKPEHVEELRRLKDQLQAVPEPVRRLQKHRPSAALTQQWAVDQLQPPSAPKQAPWRPPPPPAPGKRLTQPRKLAELILDRRLKAGDVPDHVTPTVVRGWLVDDWEAECKRQKLNPPNKPTVPDWDTVKRWWFPKPPQ